MIATGKPAILLNLQTDHHGTDTGKPSFYLHEWDKTVYVQQLYSIRNPWKVFLPYQTSPLPRKAEVAVAIL